MSHSDHSRLPDQVRLARAEAVRARRLATQQPDDDLRLTLSRFADELEARALGLEQQIAPPVVHRHATPQQMQQAQVTPPDSRADADEKPRNPE